jgi:hypothetical protein
MKGIYVETRIRGSLDELWERTQRPDVHQRWDLRFSTIEYLPRPDVIHPQQFRYATRIGFGMNIHGTGETVGQRDLPDGRRTSALRFQSDDPKSLIAIGSGYWQYLPEGDSVRFLTWYDYQTRFGLPGRLFDRLVFRPLMGWATAWSFDRLRLWLERGIEPEAARRASLWHGISRAAALGISGAALARWCYQHPWLAGGLALASIIGMLIWPIPYHIPAARRCHRRTR